MTTTKRTTKKRAVIVTTTHRGVFFGYTTDTRGEIIDLANARMAIRFGTTRGLLQLADTGPTSSSTISARAPKLEIRSITAVLDVTPAAVEAWEAA